MPIILSRPALSSSTWYHLLDDNAAQISAHILVLWAANCHLPAAWMSSPLLWMVEAFPIALECRGNSRNYIEDCEPCSAGAGGDLTVLTQKKKPRA